MREATWYNTGSMKDETDLIGAAVSLDQEALGNIFEQYAPVLFKYLLRMGLGPQEADQIVGDVFARLIAKLSEGKGPHSNLRSYLFQIAYHLVVDGARDGQRAAPLEAVERVTSDEKPVHAQTEEKMQLEILSTAIKQELTEEQRDVIVLRFQEDFSLKETAEIMGKNVNAIKALQNRGIARLREALVRKTGGE